MEFPRRCCLHTNKQVLLVSSGCLQTCCVNLAVWSLHLREQTVLATVDRTSDIQNYDQIVI